jgi:hypothetical protein
MKIYLKNIKMDTEKKNNLQDAWTHFDEHFGGHRITESGNKYT